MSCLESDLLDSRLKITGDKHKEMDAPTAALARIVST